MEGPRWRRARMTQVPEKAKPFVAFVCVCGLACLLFGMVPWRTSDGLEFACFVLLTAIASGLKAILPGFEGTLSVNFVFFLVGICNMTLPETLALGVTAAVVQCYWRATKRLHVVHFLFNLSQVAIAISAAFVTYHSVSALRHGHSPVALLLAAIVFFLLNTFPVATVVALAEEKPIVKKWREVYAWPFPYYLIGAAIAGVLQLVIHFAGWEMSVLLLPALYAIYRSYRMYLERWEDEKRHLQDIASLHMRTIETLALAIEAKDHTTGDHLQRVRVYALELATDLGLTEDETEALKAASVLHDIGKLAVPESIISKPGKLTPDEFEKMKVHPIVGSEIVQQVRFPYPVAPIVRSHHEKWDGSGYPDGLSGEAIPIGARILAAVDCLDALASDRQYRRALPLDEAMQRVDQESGKSFDPRVVSVLKARYRELERMAKSQEPEERIKLSTDVKVERGAAPAAGFASAQTSQPPSSPATKSITPESPPSATGGFSNDGPESLNLQEALSAMAARLRYSIPYDAFAVFEIKEDRLTPCFVFGENLRQISALRVPVGEGMVGWVGETGQSIVNGNPAVEPGYVEAAGSASLKSALAVPLRGADQIVGVLALYHAQAESFSTEHLAILEKQQAGLETGLEKLFKGRSDSLRTVSVEKKDLENGSRVAAAKAGAS